MGVAGLWEILRPAAKTRSLTDIAIKEGFEANPDGKRGFRLGIDASIWFFHAEYGREGENPVLRTLFFRCATLMHTTFLPLFVFDGPKRPDFKRGKKINKSGNKLIPGMKQIVEAFGFEWRMAPGEAEAELAYLNRIGVIDGILSDDVDNFLFGAVTVIRNPSNNLSGNKARPVLNSAGKDDKNHSRVFRMDDITNHADIRLTRGGLILIGLMSGGDYQQSGLERCGIATAHALAKCGFGDSLYEASRAFSRQDLSEFLVPWRHQLKEELRTNSRGMLARKQAALANAIPETFPDIDILLSYVNPITSESMGRESNNTFLTWSKEPDLAKLAGACELYFEWGYKEAIIKRFRTVMWHSIVLRILRRAVLDLDGNSSVGSAVSSTPHKSGKTTTTCGTPSKMIARHFSSSPSEQRHSGLDSDDEADDEERLILKIHSTREHASTDGLLEYRIEIAPKQLVELTASGIKGMRVPEGPDEWASDEEEDEDGGTKKRGKGKPIDPEEHMRLWMPACMVRLVEPSLVQEFEDVQEAKRLKKLKKGTRSAEGSKEKPAKSRKAKAKPVSVPDDVFTSPDKPPEKETRKATSRSAIPAMSDQDDGSSDELPECILPVIPRKKTRQVHSAAESAEQAPLQNRLTSSASTRTGIKDLTKKKTKAPESLIDDDDLKNFFAVTQKSSLKQSKGSATTSASRVISALGQVATVSSQTRPRDDHLDLEEFTSRSLNKKGPSSMSPSKRKANAGTSNSTSSESESQQRPHKSPRKRPDQVSPKCARRPVSPCPPSSRIPSQGRVIPGVIEILTDSETDEYMAPLKTVEQKAPSRSLPPLMAARERYKGRNTAVSRPPITPAPPSQDSHRRNRPEIYSDIIDLT
ncbi:hypothetical protein CVT26_008119 [Gymnopilus dilepis]|uniref:XPG-I domain-containing protein n=1 Tax=Gymnopilus dilepis TaxID=231916 RepID=A0A409YJV6_9AGAR|nr:hypothetical protein CVT26_008119 [Gymnopilus dilepis]